MAPPPPKKTRLESLDGLRGLTIFIMILVDDAGGAYPHINHSPWNGITLADVVMPWFLFMVGCSMAFSLSRVNKSNRLKFAKTVSIRAFKLLILGLIFQGYGFPDDQSYTWGYNLKVTRWCGIL